MLLIRAIMTSLHLATPDLSSAMKGTLHTQFHFVFTTNLWEICSYPLFAEKPGG